MAVINDGNLHTVLEELDEVAHNWKAIGQALGCPSHKLKQIEQTPTNHNPADCLSDMLAYRMKQLTPSRLTWKEIIKALRVNTVSAEVLANSVAEQHCPSEYQEQREPSPNDGTRGNKIPEPGQSGKRIASFTMATGALVFIGIAVLLGIVLRANTSEPPTHSPLGRAEPTRGAAPGSTAEPDHGPPSSGSKILGTRPELRDVDVIIWRDGSETSRFKLINQIINDCGRISNQFKIPKPMYESWVTHRQGKPYEVCHDMLHHWLTSGTGPYPITWRGLISVLNDVDLGEVAKDLETALSKKIQQ